MKEIIIVAVCGMIAALLIFWGIKTGSIQKVLLGLLSALSAVAVCLFKSNREKKEELKKKEAEIEARKKETALQKEVMNTHIESQKKVEEVKAEAQSEQKKAEEKINEAKKAEDPVQASIDAGNDIISSFNQL